MKKLLSVSCMLTGAALLGLLGGCQTTGSNSSAVATSQKEMLLTQAGFKTMTVTTAKQQQQVSALPVNKISAVKYKGKLYYVLPTSTKNQILVGRQKQYNAYKSALQAQSANQQAQQQMAGYPTITEETAGPNHIVVQEFDGFGPLGTDTGDF